MGKTVVEKILARAAGLPAVSAGDVVEPRVDVAMSHENAALVINQFLEIYEGTGVTAHPWDVSKIAIIFDHRVPAESPKTASNQKKIREFVDKHRISRFHDIRGDVGGICHQILPEYGYVRPGQVVVGTDSHTTSHGALGAFSFGIGATEMASVWTLGVALNIEVPTTIKIEVNGEFGAARRPEGPDPPRRRHAHGPGRQLPRPRVPRRDDTEDVHLRAPRRLQHVGRGGRHVGHRPGRRGDDPLPARGGGRHRPDRAGRPRRRRRLREGRHDRRLDARAADRLPAHRRQRQADLRGRGREGPPGRHRLLHERPDRRSRGRREHHPREEGRPGDPDARLPGFGPRLPGGARPGLRLRLHEGRAPSS